jgi:hypothetical protein
MWVLPASALWINIDSPALGRMLCNSCTTLSVTRFFTVSVPEKVAWPGERAAEQLEGQGKGWMNEPLKFHGQFLVGGCSGCLSVPEGRWEGRDLIWEYPLSPPQAEACML